MSLNTLRVAIAHNFRPFVSIENGQVGGVAIEILRAAAEQASIRVHWVPASFAELQHMMLDSVVDAIFPVAISPERQLIYRFSDPLLNTGAALFVRAPDVAPGSLDDFPGRAIATPKTGPLAGHIRQHASHLRVVLAHDYEQCLGWLDKGVVDAAALNIHVGAYLVEQLYAGKITCADKAFLELPFAVAVRIEGHDLLDRLNDGIKKITELRSNDAT